MKKYNFKIAPFARAFLENSDKTIGERIALGMLSSTEYCPIHFNEKSMLPMVSPHAYNDGTGHAFNCGISVDTNKYLELIKEYPEYADELQEISDTMVNFDTSRIYGDSLSAKDHKIRSSCSWGGGWMGHGNPDYHKVLHLGVNGIRELIAKYRAENPEKDSFYNGCDIAMQALLVLGKSVSDTAKAYAEKETDTVKKAEFERIAETFTRVPAEPAYDMYSAVMMFWMIYTYDGIDSPGRLDQFMGDYFDASPEDEREEMVHRLLEAMHEVRGWNLCISGSDENWNDQTNALSYSILRHVTEMGYNTPNLTMRVHRNTPKKLWEAAAKCIGTGIGLPALYNDEVVCAALEKLGIPPRDSHDYCMNGCNQIDIIGKSHMGLEDGEVNLGKVLELTLYDGFDYVNGLPRLIDQPFGSVMNCKTFDEFMTLFYRHLESFTDCVIDMSLRFQKICADFTPFPMRSCFFEGCLEKGLDFKAGGPTYNHGQILTEGIADTADSLYAIKRLIFDEKKYTMKELVTALINDYEGCPELHHDFKNCEKFGNDIESVDTICAEVINHFYTYLKTKKTFRGGVFTGGCSTFNRAANNGAAVGALPNGKTKNSTNYADSVAATPGCDMKGPTASIKSLMKYDQTEAGSGFVTQLKFAKSLFNTEKGLESFINIAQTYFANGGQQLSINVLDKEELLKAQEDPDKYRSLIVRVGGYSDYFCNLPPKLQQNVIDRTEFIF